MARLGRMGRGAFSFLTALLLFSVSANGQNGKAVQRKLLVASFENIVVIGDITVTITAGKSPSAIASGDKRMLESLKLERVGTTLRVRLQDVVNNNRGVPITAPFHVNLTTQDIKDVTLSGNGTLYISEIDQSNLARMLIIGNGSIKVGNLIADQFSATINGNGRIEFGGGKVRDARVTLEGAGEFDGQKVQIRKLRLEHIGNATSVATVDEAADIFNRGSGNITIGGKGSCFLKQAGAASITCTNIDTGPST